MLPLRWRRHRPHRHAPEPRDELRRFIRSPRRRVPESKLALRGRTLSPQSRFRRRCSNSKLLPVESTAAAVHSAAIKGRPSGRPACSRPLPWPIDRPAPGCGNARQALPSEAENGRDARAPGSTAVPPPFWRRRSTPGCAARCWRGRPHRSGRVRRSRHCWTGSPPCSAPCRRPGCSACRSLP